MSRSINRSRPSRAYEIPEQFPPDGLGPSSLNVTPSGITRLLLGVVGTFTLISFGSVATHYSFGGDLFSPSSRLAPLLDSLLPLFHLDQEQNVPTWYQGTILAVCGILLLLIADAHRRNARYLYGVCWGFLGVIFLFISLDELSSIHESVTSQMYAVLGINAWFLAYHFSWVIPYAVFLIILAIILIPFLRSLPTEVRSRFLVAGTIFVSGALGFELLGAYVWHTLNVSVMMFQLVQHAEELLEMLGAIAFLRALLMYIGDFSGGIVILPNRRAQQ